MAIAVIVAFPSTLLQKNEGALFYLSIAMFAFFAAAYLFNFRMNRVGPYTARCLEYTGIVAVGFGLLALFQNIINSAAIFWAYVFFAFGIMAIAIFDIYFNSRFFYQKDDGRKGKNPDKLSKVEGSGS